MLLARQGAQVALIETNPRASRRFAGEWLHPPAVAALDRARVGRLESARPRTGYGFVVLPDDGSPAIELGYPGTCVALSAEHDDLVRALRDRAVAEPGVHYFPGCRVVDLQDHRVVVEPRGGQPTEVRAGLIVGADGKGSLARRYVEDGVDSQLLSYMAGIDVRGASLPSEGFGHVILGGPGPALAYRIADDRIRLCLEVPLSFGSRARTPQFLWTAYGPVLPAGLREGLFRALEERPVSWAGARFRPRSSYGRGSVVLVGDAAGHTHPLTAVGITQGLLDAEALADANGDLEAYRRTRSRASYVPELLGNALYHVFRRDDLGAARIRAAVYDVWRTSDFERDRTMRILMGDEPRTSAFGASFARMALAAIGSSTSEALRVGAPGQAAGVLEHFREYAKWPVAAFVPQSVRARYRATSATERPVPPLSGVFAPTSESRQAQSAQPPAPQELSAEEAQALRDDVVVGVDALHDNLAGLATKFGVAPDLEVARHAICVLHAIDRATSRDIMRKRMRLGRRRLATDGPAVVAAAASTDDAAALLLALFDVEPWRDEGADGLPAVVRTLLDCQRPTGGFGPRAGARRSDVRSTELACRAMAALIAREPDTYADAGKRALRGALRWLRARQRPDGSWPGQPVENTARALRGLVAAGLPPGAPELRRGARWLVERQAPNGSWSSAPDVAPSLGLSALSLSALVVARAPYSGAIVRGARAVAAQARGVAGSVDHPAARADLVEALPAVADAVRYLEELQRLQPYVRARKPATERPARAGAEVSTPAANGAPRASAEDDWAFCKQSLAEVSRTFARPIAMLPDRLEVAVTLGYLLCRAADTIEDHEALTLGERDDMFALFLAILRGERAPSQLYARLAETAAVRDIHNPEIALCRELPRVFGVFDTLDEPRRAVCRRWVGEMVRGMSLYSHRTPGPDGITALHTVGDLERYCYFVAGTVGHLLTDLFELELGDRLDESARAHLRRHAEHFGAGLQLVNILKDVTDDSERGWSFLPRSLVADTPVDLESLIGRRQLTDARSAHAVVAPVFDLARSFLDDALGYALAIPEDQTGIRLFCLLPLWMAARTLVYARGNDAMFEVGAPVKISRAEVEGLIADCVRDSASNQRLARAYEGLWLPRPQLASRGERHAR